MTIDSSPEACLVSLSPSPKSFSPNSANSDTDCANKSNTEDENPLPKRNGNCPPDVIVYLFVRCLFVIVK
jgi:hypothetical protein